MIRKFLCRIHLHKWESVGVTGFFMPIDKCVACGSFEVFTGLSTIIYPPGTYSRKED